MIPAAFVSVASFPLTPSGKLDRKALPPPDVAARETDAASLEPRTPTEKVLARIWCEILDLKQVGVRDNFFDLGGNSRLVVLVIGEINKTLNARLNVPAFFQNPTIEGLTQGSLSRRIMSDLNCRCCGCSQGIPVCRFISSAPGQSNIGSRN